MLFVHITSALVGEGFIAELDSGATAFDLKRLVRVQDGVRASMVNVLFRNRLLGNAEKIYHLSAVASWLFIEDITDAETPRVLVVSYVIKRPECEACGQPAEHNCGRCRASYCSRACQLADWQNHRHSCAALACAGRSDISRIASFGSEEL